MTFCVFMHSRMKSWLRRKPLRVVLERARVMLTELLIAGDGIDDDSQRGLIKEIVTECKPFKKNMERFKIYV